MRNILYTLHDASQVDEVTQLNEYKVLAKKVVTDNLTRFFLKEIGSRVVNPFETTVSDMKQSEGNMIEVSEDVYNLYHKIINYTSRASFSSIQTLMSN